MPLEPSLALHSGSPRSRVGASVFHEVYDTQRKQPLDTPVSIPPGALGELLVFTLLAPLLVADLEREFLPLLACSDASPSFGFGVSVRKCCLETITQLASRSERHGDYLTFDDDVLADKTQRRVGQPIQLPFSMESFTDVLSIKATHVEHSGKMEAHGLLLMVQWALRSVARFSSRLVVGVDATVVLSAALKGRSSAPTLTGSMRSIAAHCLAGDLLLYPLWVPSRFNPADAPSRGKRRRPSVRKRLQKPCRLEKLVEKQRACLQRLVTCGMLTPSEDSSLSTCSW